MSTVKDVVNSIKSKDFVAARTQIHAAIRDRIVTKVNDLRQRLSRGLWK